MARPPSSRESARVRKIYEQRPYPAPDESALKFPRAVPTEWIKAAAGIAAPRRILVAGCGAGSEAFVMRRAFPGAEIVAVDFSPRSIGIARELQRCEPSLRDIRFLVADLASRNLRGKTGGGFDLVSCHGVLTYIPEPQRTLENLSRCATPDGALYLGVNGPEHCSVALRKALPHFGFDMAELHDGPDVRQALRVCDAIQRNRGAARSARMSAVLLAGDVFSPVMQNDGLAEWVRRAREAGWHFEASQHAQRQLRDIWQEDIGWRLLPRSRGEACLLADALQPGGFHRLVFSRQPVANPPWEDHEALLAWKPAATPLYSMRLARAATGGLRTVTLKSTPLNTRLDWRLPEWGVEILRRSDGRHSLREILASCSARDAMVRRQLYLLYQLMVLNFAPPGNP